VVTVVGAGFAVEVRMRRIMLLVVSLVAVLAVSGAAGSAGSTQTRWVIRDLGVFTAAGINERGQVVGSAPSRMKGADGKPIWHAFRWERGRLSDLGTLVKGGPSYATAINERGQVVGWSSASAVGADSRVFLWERGSMREVVRGRGGRVEPQVINGRGNVLIAVTSGSNPARAVLLRDGKLLRLPVDLGRFYGSVGISTRLNDRNQVVGSRQTSGGERPVLWEGGRLRYFSGARWLGGRAVAINEGGQVVGWSWPPKGSYYDAVAFLWRNGTARDIGRPPGTGLPLDTDMNNLGEIVTNLATFDGHGYQDGNKAYVWREGKWSPLPPLEDFKDVYTVAFGINDGGQIVGWCGMKSNQARACLWEHGRVTDLGTLGGTASMATAINNHGEIIGSATNKNGQQHAVLWTLRSG
jgi:probable HAF family extracellular repeat protein